jgi:excinuclease ABC subunit C
VPTLSEQATRLPQDSGVYFFISHKGKTLYIGKAKNLRDRVLQYINGQDDRVMVQQLLLEAARIDFTVTSSEKGALILEASEIHCYRPKFNIALLDGSQFLHFCIDSNHPWPKVSLERFPRKKKGVQYFGPYPDATSARRTMEFIDRLFPLRSCSDETLRREKRLCLQYHMHRCLGPCVEKCSGEEYNGVQEQVIDFLKGNNPAVIKKARQRMSDLSIQLRFEEAAVQRDLIRSIEKTFTKQQVSLQSSKDIDYWGIYKVGNEGVVSILPYRRGQMKSSIAFPFSGTVEELPKDMLSSLLNSWYQNEVPDELIVPWLPSANSILEEVLTERAGQVVHIKVPVKGKKVQVLNLAYRNAEAQYKQHRSQSEQNLRLLEALQNKLQLRRLPLRIECFDNSNLQGTDAVAAMIVFKDAKANKRLYKKFRIKIASGDDDYAAMYEILSRRFLRAKMEVSESWELPDLLIVDGGRGQVNVACRVLQKLQITTVDVIGISKPRVERKRGDTKTSDKIILPKYKDAIVLKRSDPLLLFLQRIRDETHNTAVEYQRTVRGKRKFSSTLQDIPGVGEVLRVNLIKYFGSFKAIKQATVVELQQVPLIGPRLAVTIYNHFHSSSDS